MTSSSPLSSPVSVCRSLESSTDQTLVAKSLLAPRMRLPVVSKSIPITAALLPVRVALRSIFIPERNNIIKKTVFSSQQPTSAYFPDLNLSVRPGSCKVLSHGVPFCAHYFTVVGLKAHLDLGGYHLTILDGSLPSSEVNKLLWTDALLLLQSISVKVSSFLTLFGS